MALAKVASRLSGKPCLFLFPRTPYHVCVCAHDTHTHPTMSAYTHTHTHPVSAHTHAHPHHVCSHTHTLPYLLIHTHTRTHPPHHVCSHTRTSPLCLLTHRHTHLTISACWGPASAGSRGALRMNSVVEREKTRETSLDRAKSVFYFLTSFIPSLRTFSRYKMLTHAYTGLVLHHFVF